MIDRIDEFRAAVLANVHGPVGTIRPTASGDARPGHLLLDGRWHSRAAYPELWAWAVAADLVRDGLFGAGDGCTSFSLPDFRGRSPAPAPAGYVEVRWMIATGAHDG